MTKKKMVVGKSQEKEERLYHRTDYQHEMSLLSAKIEIC